MRIYSAFEEEALRIRRLLKDWVAGGFVTESQRVKMEGEIPCTLRRTSVFLRAVLFLFTLGSVGALVGLTFVLFFSSNRNHEGIALMVFAGFCIAGAEYMVLRWRLYRHGIEEAMAVLAVLLLCAGLEMVLPRGSASPIIPGVGAVGCFLLYRRYGYLYAFLAAVILATLLPHYWTASAEALVLGPLYAASLVIIVLIRRAHRYDVLDEEYSAVEAILWMGLYLVMNLQLSATRFLANGSFNTLGGAPFSKLFYWTTYALIWILPAVALRRALGRKDRPLLELGLVMALLTLITNKSYLGWTRHEWDPMLLGIFLVSLAVGIRRWLAQGAGGVRDGFTARRMSGRDKKFMNNLAGTAGLSYPHTQGSVHPDSSFGGGSAGGGGASGSY